MNKKEGRLNPSNHKYLTMNSVAFFTPNGQQKSQESEQISIKFLSFFSVHRAVFANVPIALIQSSQKRHHNAPVTQQQPETPRTAEVCPCR